MNFKKTITILVALCKCAILHAYDLPQVNYGLTSFVDGGPPAGPGWYYQTYAQWFKSSEFTDSEGNEILFPTANGMTGAELETVAIVNQILYQSNKEIIKGAKWGIQILMPYVQIDLNSDSIPLSANSAGFGDPVIGPYLQWDPIIRDGKPFMLNRVEFSFVAPIGKYSASKAVNPGSNVFSFNPYWAATLFAGNKTTISWRLHYLWNDKNTDIGDPAVQSVQAGQAVHLNYSIGYEIIAKQLRIGINGYALKQITDSKVNDIDTKGRREEVLSFGPGMVYHFGQENHLFINTYFDLHAENRPKGNRINIRWVHHF